MCAERTFPLMIPSSMQKDVNSSQSTYSLPFISGTRRQDAGGQPLRTMFAWFAVVLMSI